MSLHEVKAMMAHWRKPSGVTLGALVVLTGFAMSREAAAQYRSYDSAPKVGYRPHRGAQRPDPAPSFEEAYAEPEQRTYSGRRPTRQLPPRGATAQRRRAPSYGYGDPHANQQAQYTASRPRRNPPPMARPPHHDSPRLAGGFSEADIFYDDGPAERVAPPGGTPYYGEGPGEGDVIYEDFDAFHGHGHGHGHGDFYYPGPYEQEHYPYCGGCESCGVGCCLPFFPYLFENLTVFGGAEGFKSNVDFGNNGNFGLSYGVNFGRPVPFFNDLAFQVGGRVVQSNLSGYDTVGVFETDARNQFFVTAGIFRRFRHCTGLQWGVVYDYLSDEYYVDMNLGQVRGEISFRGPKQFELGVWVAANVADDEQPVPAGANQLANFPGVIGWETQDQYNFFVRRQGCGGEFRVWGGFTDDSDGIFGGDFRAAITHRFAVVGGFNYLIPNESAEEGGFQQEAWGVGVNLVWHIGGRAQCASCSPFRPLFEVANNATMITDLQPAVIVNGQE